MNAIKIMLNELKISFRTPVSFMLLLVMPITMIIMMGFALKPVFQLQEKGFQKPWVLYVNRDSGKTGQAFDAYIKAASKYSINLAESNTQDVEKTLSAEKLPVAIVIPDTMTSQLSSGKNAQIQIIGSGKDAVCEGIVQSLVKGFTDTINTSVIISKEFRDLQTSDKNNEAWLKTAAVNGGDGFNTFIKEYAVERPASERVNSFQHYSISMLVFFLLACGAGLGVSIINDRRCKIFKRINSYPVTANQYLLGKTLGNAVLGLMQSFIIVIFTSLVFNIQWSNNYLGVFIVILSIISISSGIAITLSSILNSSKALSAVLMVVFWILTFISGGFAVIPLFESVSKYTINKWAFDAMAGFIMKGSIQSASTDLILLVATGVILWFIGIILYKRRAICE